MNFTKFFDNLPILPFSEVCKHVPLAPLVSLFLSDKSWETAISRSAVREHAIINVFIDGSDFTVKMEMGNDRKFEICLENKGNEEMAMSWVSQRKCDTLDFSIKHRFQLHSNSAKILQNSFTKLLFFVMKLHRPTYHRIDVLTHSRAESDFAYHLLSQIPRRYLKSVQEVFTNTLSGDDKVGKEDYLKFLSKITVHYSFYSNVEIDGDVDQREDIILTAADYLELKDARFMSSVTMKSLNCERGFFYKSLLNSEDFRDFLKSWKMGNNENLKKWEFTISDNQHVDIKEIVEGLDAVPWDPTVRDRVLIEYEESHNTDLYYWDMKNGMDIVNVNGMLATICLIDKVLIFGIWKRRFPIGYYEGEWNAELAICERMNQRDKERKKEYERRMEEEEDFDKEQIHWMDQSILNNEKYIERLREYLELMNTEWR